MFAACLGNKSGTLWHMGTGPIQLQFQLLLALAWAPCGAREKRRCVRLRLGGCRAFLASSVYVVEAVRIWGGDGGLNLLSHVFLLSVLRCDLSGVFCPENGRRRRRKHGSFISKSDITGESIAYF